MQETVAIIGLGYVGLPLAVAFGREHSVIGFDISAQRINELNEGHDSTNEVGTKDLSEAKHLRLTSDARELSRAQIYIVTVPTPVDSANRPDFSPLVSACHTVGAALEPGNIVIFESTVYPGATEEVCVPVLEAASNLRYNETFYCGYSPERINPGDKNRRLESIVKITSGSTPDVAEKVDALYRRIISAGTHKASSIKVAEAAKVIENTQRDVNIALMNELSLIFSRLGIDTQEVLEAAGTKWNFLPFRPGLVGGHCIGVDPYYLTHKAQEIGYHPEVILAGRRINDGMAQAVADRTVKLMLRNMQDLVRSKVLVLGLTFKENCPDLRNSKVFDVISALSAYMVQVDAFDPWVSADLHTQNNFRLLRSLPTEATYDAIVVAVAHGEFLHMGIDKIKKLGRREAVIFDVKGLFPSALTSGRL